MAMKSLPNGVSFIGRRSPGPHRGARSHWNCSGFRRRRLAAEERDDALELGLARADVPHEDLLHGLAFGERGGEAGLFGAQLLEALVGGVDARLQVLLADA